MVFIEDLLETDLATASKKVAGELSDITAALNQLVPRLIDEKDRKAVRRYCFYADYAAQWLSNLPAHNPDALPPAAYVYDYLRRNAVALPWAAPTADGLGVIAALVDRLRGVATGLPQEHVQPSREIDGRHFAWFLKTMSQEEFEMKHIEPLRRAMETLNLSKSDVASLMGVTRQAVDKWLLAGPPSERAPKISAIAELGDILRYRLLPGLPGEVVRRPAEAYGGRTMLEVISNDEHEWLLQSTKDIFDFTRVA